MQSTKPPSPPSHLVALFFVVCIAAFLSLQFHLGAFRSDLGGDPDEAAHAVTALMVHDYLWLAPGTSPMAFANQYYATFPKVALGHYPPGYYLTAATALSLWCDPRALIVLQSLLIAALATASWLFARRWITSGDAWLALFPSLILLFQNEVVRVGCHVMADFQLALLVFAALWAWQTYLTRPSYRSSLAFGLFAAAAILTKGTAMGLAGVPILTLIMNRRWQDLTRLSWWAAALPVLIFAGPWMIFSVRFTQEGFMTHDPAAFLKDAIAYYRHTLPRFFSWPLLALLLGSIIRLLKDIKHRTTDPVRITLWSGWLSIQILIMIVPSGLSPRYLLAGLLPATLLATIELQTLLRHFSKSHLPGTRQTQTSRVAFTAFTLLTLFLTWRVEPKTVSGFSAAINRLLLENPSQKKVWLVASDPRGEGALIAASAFNTTDRTSDHLTLVRGSKALANSDWMGRDYTPKYQDASSLLNLLDSLQIDTAIVDLSVPTAAIRPHETDLRLALDQPHSGWHLAWTQPATRSSQSPTANLLIYQRTAQPSQP